jgi:hypothetical protein
VCSEGVVTKREPGESVRIRPRRLRCGEAGLTILYRR